MAKSIATTEIIRTERIPYQSIEIQSNNVYRIQKTHSKITELLGDGVLVRPTSKYLHIQSLLNKE